MTMQVVLLISLAIILSSVEAQSPKWTGLKCGVDNQKMYDRNLGADTCKDYCVANSGRGLWNGLCEINNGYGECKCTFVRP